jgi:hypothetical protein
MLRRNLRRLQRYPSMTLLLIGMPIVFLLLFVYVFGGQLSQGLGTADAGGQTGRAGYLNYVTPGILLMTVAAAVQGAIVVAEAELDLDRPPADGSAVARWTPTTVADDINSSVHPLPPSKPEKRRCLASRTRARRRRRSPATAARTSPTLKPMQ